jgi:hypothetical protein
MKLWQSTFEALPDDLQTVWIRRWRWSDEPVLADWHDSQQEFKTTWTSIAIPAWAVQGWRHQ